MGWRAQECGKSEGPSVMGGIGIEGRPCLPDSIPYESGQTSTWSFITREFAEPAKKGNANEGSICLCTLPQNSGLERDRLANSPPECAPAASAYREGSATKKIWHGSEIICLTFTNLCVHAE